MEHPALIKSHPLSDFLGINWSGRDLKFLRSLPDFEKVVIPSLYRAPDFPPEPQVIDTEEECITAEETPFKIFVLQITRQS